MANLELLTPLLNLWEQDQKISLEETEINKERERVKELTLRLQSENSKAGQLKKKSFTVERDLKTLESNQSKLAEQLARRKESLDHATDTKSCELLQREVDELQGKIRAIDDQMLALMEENENLVAAVAHENSLLKGEDKFVQQKVSQYEQEIARRQRILTTLKAARTPLAEQVSPEIYKRYMKVKSSITGAAIVFLKDEEEYCAGCGMQLTSADISVIKSGGLGTCEQCQRLVLWRIKK